MEMYHKSKRKDENLPLSPSSNADEFNFKFYFSSSTAYAVPLPRWGRLA